MTSPVPLARRVMSARWNSYDRGRHPCPLCPGGAGTIRVGQQIALLDGYGWCHIRCAIAARRETVRQADAAPR